MLPLLTAAALALASAFAAPQEDAASATAPPLPIVLWHGMGDTCCDPLTTGGVEKALAKHYGVPVLSINSGSGSATADFASGFLGNANDEVAKACAFLREHKDLHGGFNLVGFSQGGQFARAVVQRCGHTGLDVRSLITFGGQHQGIVNLPGCAIAPKGHDPVKVGAGCKFIMRAVGSVVYLPLVRSYLIQSQYFKAPFNLGGYLAHNPFLPDLNNEKNNAIKSRYKDNLLALDSLVLVRFDSDVTVVPRDSAWFSWYNGHKLVPLEKQMLWKEDRLGLRQLSDEGKLHFESVPGGHMQFSMSEFLGILDKYLVRTHSAAALS